MENQILMVYFHSDQMVLELIVGATVLVSLASLVGIATLVAKRSSLDKILFFFVSFAAGTFLAAAFLDLIPESLETLSVEAAMLAVIAGVLAFFSLEKVISWHHHHSHHANAAEAHEKPVGYLNLVGDGLHNFFDGIAIAASFTTSVPLGITTTFAVLLHEIPQELGDFSVLVYSGFSTRKALLFNLATALAAVAGGLAFYFFSSTIQSLANLAIPFTAGMFIYMAGADIFPELHKETNPRKSLLQLLFILAGVAVIYYSGKMLGV